MATRKTPARKVAGKPKGRGGARPGSGRPPLGDAAKNQRVVFYIDWKDRCKLELLGGQDWLRAQIDGAKVVAGAARLVPPRERAEPGNAGERYGLNLTKDDKAKLAKLGGADWLRMRLAWSGRRWAGCAAPP